ncbi:MAG: hypothetical protein ACI85Q_001653 [Salibacteraceae bacterium]|jgi:hypothetical protein
MFGNVAEMVSTKEIAKGGSWLDHQLDIELTTRSNYTKPNNTVGFRCIFQVEFEITDS